MGRICSAAAANASAANAADAHGGGGGDDDEKEEEEQEAVLYVDCGRSPQEPSRACKKLSRNGSDLSSLPQ